MAKVMISIPDDLLERIDRLAGEQQLSRSGFLRKLAVSELDRPTPEAVRRALDEGQRLFTEAGPFESEELIREARDERTRRDESLL
jgi:predicted transcriptional regulator